MEILNYLVNSFNYLKKDIPATVLYGSLLLFLLFIFFLLPILGQILFSLFFVRITKWYYKRLDILEKEVDNKPAILCLIILSLLFYFSIIFIFLYFAFYLFETLYYSWNIDNVFLLLGKILSIIFSILSLIFIYTIFGNLIGREEKFRINIKKSLIIGAISSIAMIIPLIMYLSLILLILKFPLYIFSFLWIYLIFSIFLFPYFVILNGILAKNL